MSNWAADELGGADLGDERLNRRLQRMVAALSAQPGASVPQAMGDWAATKGAYRFWDQKSVTAAAILAPHQAQSVARAGGQERVQVQAGAEGAHRWPVVRVPSSRQRTVPPQER